MNYNGTPATPNHSVNDGAHNERLRLESERQETMARWHSVNDGVVNTLATLARERRLNCTSATTAGSRSATPAPPPVETDSHGRALSMNEFFRLLSRRGVI